MCPHEQVESGRCARCGACVHDVILNGACYHCGATDVQVTVKPVTPPAVVPAGRLKRRREP